MKAKIVFLVIFLLLANLASSQVKFRVKKLNADSLVALIPKKEGIKQVDVMNLLSNVICRQNIDSSILLATQAIELSEKLEYQKGLADGYFNVGNGYFLLDSLEATISNYLKALRFYEDLEPTQEYGNLCMQLFIINLFTGRDESARNYAKQAKNAYENIGDKPGQAMATWVCCTEGNAGDWENGIEYSKKALTFLDPAHNKNEAAFIYNSMGETYLNGYHQTGDTSLLDTALSWCFKALKLEEMDDDVKTAVYFTIGGVVYQYHTDGSIAIAVDYFHKANRQADSSFDAYYWKPFINMYLGQVYYDQGNYNASIQYFKQGIKIIEESFADFSINAFREPVLGLNFKRHNKVYHQGMLKGLHDAYAAKGEYKLALKYFTLSKEAEEETYHEKFQNMITMMEADSKAEKKEKQMALLASDNELKALTILQSRIIILVIIGLFIIIIFIGILFLRQNKLTNEHKTVVLEQKLLRLQMNPHFIFNALSNIMNFINKKDTDSAANYLTNFSHLLRTTLESSREDYILLEEEVSSIRNYLNLQLLRYSDKFDYSIDIDDKLDIENSIIPPMLIQPFIENAIEHGIRHKEGKGHIQVRFSLNNNKVTCEVEDDGVGRKKAWEAKVQKQKTHRSLATEIITDRIQALNKKLKQTIKLSIIDLQNENNDPAGTKVVLVIPYLID